MITTKPIIADPLRLYELGLRNLMDMAILVHIARCGLIGARRASIADAIKVPYDTAHSGVVRLKELGLVTAGNRPHTGHSMVCTVRGWNLMTQPADFTMFPHSQLALQNHASRKKSRKETPSENQTPAADAPGIDVASGGNDDHPENPAEESITERADALGREIESHEAGPGTSQADGPECADGAEGSGAE